MSDPDTKVELKAGDKAPDFTAQVQNPNGTVVNFNLYNFLKQGKKILLVFYPGDNTPGCATQLCGIRDVFQEYAELGIAILGVNPANEKSHLKFITRYSFPFGIAMDEDKIIRQKYGATKMYFGNETTKRSVFLIDTDGGILFIHWGQQDNQQVIDLVKNNQQF